MITTLKYGNTNTYLLRGSGGSLLIDTDFAGTLPAFYKAIKQQDIRVDDIEYVLATHYHPDHMGLISELMQQGVKLLLIDTQLPHIHFSDALFARDKHLNYRPIDAEKATVISCAEGRSFLKKLGIAGEIISTASHSADGIALILDSGEVFVGDLEPLSYIEAYEDNQHLQADWQQLLCRKAQTIYFAHRPPQSL